jgi:hypothetical protein
MKIDSFSGKFSVHKSEIVLLINNEEHNISYLFPKHSYTQYELNNPEINWTVRKEMIEEIRKYIKDLDPDFPVEKLVC